MENSKKVMLKKYGNEEIYKMVTLVLHYPDAGHSGKQFWISMMNIYGDSVLEGRNSGALREKWRKIGKDHPTDLEEYKKKLTEELPKDLIDDIENKINIKLLDPSQNTITNKRHSKLLPNIFNGEGVKKIKLSNGKNEEFILKKSAIKKSTLGRSRIGKFLISNDDIRNPIDLSQVLTKKCSGISKTIKKLGLPDVDGEAKEFVAGKDPTVTNLNELLQSTNEVVQNLEAIQKLLLEKDNEWNELEDMALKHPENSDIQECLARIKNEEAMNKRKKLLGI